jgi:cbb3-type cytochrome oxidase cytochrome c subunit
MKRFIRMSYLAAGVAGLGFFAMSVLLLAVWPGRVLERQIRATSPDRPLPLTDSEQRGRTIYGQNGCAYCHTQQIRYLDRDVRRFGAATLAWETIFDYPQLWGTRRIGPDLSREGSIRTPDWQFAHLYDPRHMVPDSVMPPFAWLFDGAPDRPEPEARDLLAYLETLGRNRELAGPEGEARARAACECSISPVLNASAAVPRRKGDYPKLTAPSDLTQGRRLYVRDCASCHGYRGEGNGAGTKGLLPQPTNLAAHEYTLDRVSFSLWNGVEGTAMPAWRDLPLEDLSALAAVVRRFHSFSPETAPSQAIMDMGARIYADRCAQCHGEKGGGDGPAADRFPIAASNFRAARPSFDASLHALRDGVDGTPMAPYASRLSADELSAAAYFVRGFFQP